MEIAVRQAAERLGVSEPRVRQLLASGDLAGRRLGVPGWSRLSPSPGCGSAAPGRPAARWVRSGLGRCSTCWSAVMPRGSPHRHAASSGHACAGWPALPPASGVRRCGAVARYCPAGLTPTAIPRLVGHEGVLPAGLAVLEGRPFDLVIAGHVIDQAYVDPVLWPALSSALAIRPAGPDHPGAVPNLTVFLPRIAWPFQNRRELPDSVLAADLLDSAEPRAVRAGAWRLDELLKEHLP